jgi:hypothetical protein
MRRVLVLLIGLWAAPLAAQPAPQAVVVLIGEAHGNVALSDVIAELLLRQNVQAQVESRERFDPDVWLDESSADPRSFAFVSVPDEQRAQLYFRGPRGERFMLRELTLRNGLDEVGRELIARVVETSTVALMNTKEGVSREQARAELAKEAAPKPEPALRAEPPPPEQRQPEPRQPVRLWSALIGLRTLAHYSGEDLGARVALGLEGGGRTRAGAFRLGVRLTAEVGLPQTLAAEGVEASVLTIPLRLGIDAGTGVGLFVALSTGFDLVHLAPERAADASLTLMRDSTELTPVSRAELRYELALSRAFYVAFSALLDVPWTATHYDVAQGGTLKHLATPWRVQPGAAITLGATP